MKVMIDDKEYTLVFPEDMDMAELGRVMRKALDAYAKSGGRRL